MAKCIMPDVLQPLKIQSFIFQPSNFQGNDERLHRFSILEVILSIGTQNLNPLTRLVHQTGIFQDPCKWPSQWQFSVIHLHSALYRFLQVMSSVRKEGFQSFP